jgi:hypothetical protein
MVAAAGDSPVIPIPERIDRRMRLGPFSSGRDALRCLTYGAIGALLVPLVSPWVGLVVAAGGFGLTAYRVEGTALDELAATYLLWLVRSHREASRMTAGTRSTVRSNLLLLPSGDRAAIVRTNGTPTAYLPPTELVRRFEMFRELIRASRKGLAFAVVLLPMRPEPVVPKSPPTNREDFEAAAGYRQLVTLVCRRRWVRGVDVVLRTTSTGPDGVADLETRLAGLIERLTGFGLAVVRLEGRALADAGRRWGWSVRRTVP